MHPVVSVRTDARPARQPGRHAARLLDNTVETTAYVGPNRPDDPLAGATGRSQRRNPISARGERYGNFSIRLPSPAWASLSASLKYPELTFAFANTWHGDASGELVSLTSEGNFAGDFQKIRDFVSHISWPHTVEVIKENPAGGRYKELYEGDIGMRILSYGAEVRITVPQARDCYKIYLLLRGAGIAKVEGKHIDAPSIIVGPQERADMWWSVDHEVLIVHIPSALIERTLADYLGDPLKQALRFRPDITCDSPFHGLLTTLSLTSADGRLPFMASPLAGHHFEQLLLHTLLDSQPHDYSATRGGPEAASGPAALRRAQRYCEEHAGECVSLRDIAAAARVSVRTLQYDFRHHLHTTPLAYLRKVRLEHAHADLVRMAQTGTQATVAEVATRWGFMHLGRFSCLYRDTYGRPPSSTLYGSR
jgi:AraC-like DNA-binding protein